MRILLTGAGGFIGSAIAAGLLREEHEVIGVSRRTEVLSPYLSWVALDFRSAREESWLPHLQGIDVVINCVGVLQDGFDDSTRAAHVDGAAALFMACQMAGVRRVIQLSAIGAEPDAPTAFSRSKAEGDALLRSSALDWVILRPSVVLGAPAYGGSALFRGLATLPVLPVPPDTGELQVVQLDDVVASVLFFLRPDAPSRLSVDLCGPERLYFADIIAEYRRWLGRKPAREVRVPPGLMSVAFALGDLAGWLGWRPPMRSTAAAEIKRGAVGDPAPWTALTGRAPRALRASLMATPPSVQERWFGALYVLKPFVFGVFSLFWIATGLISLGPGWTTGVELVREGGLSALMASMAVLSGALADLAIGLGIAFRRTARPALYAALALSLVYVVLGTWLLPRLWMDPLGPMLKIWPILSLNLMALAILRDR